MAPDEDSSQETQDMPAVEEPAASQSPWEAHTASESGDDPLPLVGAAFAGGFVLARILKHFGGDD